MILVNEKDCVVNVSIILAATANCRPVIFRMPWRRPLIGQSAGLSKAENNFLIFILFIKLIPVCSGSHET